MNTYKIARLPITLAKITVDKNSTVVFPAPLMTTIQELGAFLAHEMASVSTQTPGAANGALAAARPT